MESTQEKLIEDTEVPYDNEKIRTNYDVILKGIPSSPGISFGKAFVIMPEIIMIPTEHIPQEDIPEELNRFDIAVSGLTKEILETISKVKSDAKNVIGVLETNLLVLNDSFFITAISKRISKGFSAENAIIQEFDSQKQYLNLSKDLLIRERAIELDHLKERFLSVLRNKEYNYDIPENSIIIAQTITPTDVVNFHNSGIIGIITEVGGIASHSSILARSLEIPAVIGVKEATLSIDNDMDLIIDGYAGTIILNPSKKTFFEYSIKKQKEQEHKQHLGALIKVPSKTTDGRKIHLLTNVDFPDDVENAIMVGAEGIGLVRSEHLVVSLNHFPDEEEQFKWYNEIAERAYPNPVTIRAFDVGSDKFAEGVPKHENNPALGLRGIRFLLSRKDIFVSQIKAILRASKNKNIRIMLPMVSSIKEIQLSLSLTEECKNILSEQNIPFDANIPVGIMIETPAAALLSKAFAQYSDFFSIGTNDLTQYSLAADRTNELVSDIFDHFHPAVIRLIQMTAEAASSRGIPVGICGELAGHAAATPLLIGLGINELSVSPSILLELKHRIRETSYKESLKLTKRILKCNSYEEIKKNLALV
jgi:phosphotransferase system enzyme I (PtsI)